MSFPPLQSFTIARVGLSRAGNSLPTRELLELQLAHARARDAVWSRVDGPLLVSALDALGGTVVVLHSAAPDRATYLRRPDLGRRLSPGSLEVLGRSQEPVDVAFVMVDGLSALAVQKHAAGTLSAVLNLLPRKDWTIGPITLVEQGRVAIGDEVGHALGAAMVVVLVGERPGLSSADSLGIYLTWKPGPGVTDADRNCISNVHERGLSYAEAAYRLAFLMNESRRRRLSGVALKEEAPARLAPSRQASESSGRHLGGDTRQQE